MVCVEEFKSFEHSVGNRVLEMEMKNVAYLLIILDLIFVFKNTAKSDSISIDISALKCRSIEVPAFEKMT